MTSDLSIREANSSDIEPLCKLYFEFHKFHVRGVPDRLLSLGEPPDIYEHSELYRTLEKIINDDDSALFRAKDNEAHIVTLGPLVLFSTETGDAWMLDPKDGLALCLARDGEEQPFTITETPTNFSIEWNAHYHIDGDAFIVIEWSGRIKTTFVYPTREILQATRRVR